MKIEEMISANRADCSGCEACANVCPKNAIEMRRDAEGFAYPTINRKLCVSCGKCDATCPALNFTKKFPDTLPKVFAAINPDEKIRRHSSSGGAFTALSELVLQSGGVVFGAGFDENFHVKHTAAHTPDELENLRGSKYVQSKIDDVYRRVRDMLKSTSVLFSGTPCQCAGLKKFLGGDNENLLTVDIICHGTPSPALWENYIGELGYAHEIRHVNFRSKRKGWATSQLEINFADQGHSICPVYKDIYGKLFLSGVSERPSCHACKFKFPNGQSDLTLGDAWGVQSFEPEMFDNRGTSVIFVHTPKGKAFLERTTLKMRQVKFFDAVKSNPAMMVPLAADVRRGNFFAHYSTIADKFAVMQHYAQQDDSAIRKQVSEQNHRALMQSLQEIAANVRQKFERNILILATPRDEREQKILGEYFEQNIPNVGVYIMRPVGNGKIFCTENFSSMNFALNETPDVLSAFAKQFRVAAIFVERSIKFDSPVVVEWLKSCGLPIQTFTMSQK